MPKPKIGVHVRRGAGGLAEAPTLARAQGGECLQLFSRSPRGGKAPPIPEHLAREFRGACRRYRMSAYIHAPYYINFASGHNRISFGSVSAVREDLQRGTLLGAEYVMTHLGSATGLGENAALQQVARRIQAIYDPKQLGAVTTKLLLEISAGAGGIVGDTFEQLGFIFKRIGRPDVGICLDTCHLFASGYDIRTPEAITKTMRQFARHLPLTAFKLLHANDAAVGLGEHKDRHASIGDGQLGTDTFRHLLHHRDFQGRDFVLETPAGEPRRKKDVALLKRLRDG